MAENQQVKVSNPGEDPLCAICLESLASRKTRRTPCDHEFHADCLTSWFVTDKDRMSCPNCRLSCRRNNGLKYSTARAQELRGCFCCCYWECNCLWCMLTLVSVFYAVVYLGKFARSGFGAGGAHERDHFSNTTQHTMNWSPDAVSFGDIFMGCLMIVVCFLSGIACCHCCCNA